MCRNVKCEELTSGDDESAGDYVSKECKELSICIYTKHALSMKYAGQKGSQATTGGKEVGFRENKGSGDRSMELLLPALIGKYYIPKWNYQATD